VFDFSTVWVVLTGKPCDWYAFELLEYLKFLTIILLAIETLCKGYAQKGHRKLNTNLS